MFHGLMNKWFFTASPENHSTLTSQNRAEAQMTIMPQRLHKPASNKRKYVCVIMVKKCFSLIIFTVGLILRVQKSNPATIVFLGAQTAFFLYLRKDKRVQQRRIVQNRKADRHSENKVNKKSRISRRRPGSRLCASEFSSHPRPGDPYPVPLCLQLLGRWFRCQICKTFGTSLLNSLACLSPTTQNVFKW